MKYFKVLCIYKQSFKYKQELAEAKFLASVAEKWRTLLLILCSTWRLNMGVVPLKTLAPQILLPCLQSQWFDVK